MSKFIELETQYGLIVVNVENINSFTTSNLNVTPEYPTYIVFKCPVAKPNLLNEVENVVCKSTYDELKSQLCSLE